MNTLRLDSSERDLKQAACLLNKGETVAFPTETVYGLGANALDSSAVDKIFAAKGRPSDNPLIVHIAHKDQLVMLVKEIPDIALQLMDAFWPGPLTLILPRTERVPDKVTAGLSTVAVRMPDHSIALELIKQAALPIAAPSANRSGRPSPTTAGHVLEDLDGRIAAVVDGGETGVGVESTVLDVTTEPPMILRPGGITKEMLEKVIGQVAVDPTLNVTAGKEERKEAPRSPGMKYTHYAPKGDLWIVEGDVDKQVPFIQELVDKSRAEGVKTGVLTTTENLHKYRADAVVTCGRRQELESVAAGLYAALREFDQRGMERIYAESFPQEEIGLAIMNRLYKAAGYKIVRV